MRGIYYLRFKITIYLVYFAGVREGRIVFFEQLDKLANLTLFDDANQQGFVRVRVHALGMQQGNTSM